MNHTKLISLFLTVTLLVACKPKAVVPEQYSEVPQTANIYPDYVGVTVPPNIAPLNFMVRDSLATAYVAQLQGGDAQLLAAAGEDGIVQMDSTEWRQLLTASRGADVTVTIYAKRPDGWVRFSPHVISVAEEPIDAFLSYRLIEPGYEVYRQMGLYQRNLTTFEQTPIYENNRMYDDDENHCVNCHNYRSGSTRDMLFHVRASHGGTVIVQDGKAHKVQIKDSTLLASAVYPSWHPRENLIAFSTNVTGQIFHVYHQEKIEVLDKGSDLLLYDVSANEISHVLRTSDDYETFPCWSPDGSTLYYCNAPMGHIVPSSLSDSIRNMLLTSRYADIRYNLMSIPFDAKTRRFGQPRLEVDAVSDSMSISVPRVSPDGRFVLYTRGSYGNFHIWHTSSDLWVKDLERDSCYALSEANSPDVDSFHSWSSNGRWFAVSSRRMDSNYTRIFLAYFDKEGRARKAFVLPQEDPEMNYLLLRSYNVPELTRDAVSISRRDLSECVLQTDGEPCTYRANPTAIIQLDGTTGASPKK